MSVFDTVKFRTFDYSGFKNALFDVATSNPDFPEWTDVLESNQGVMFVEWLAFIGGSLCFTQNYQARQCFVPTATEASSIAKLAKQFDYDIPNNSAASVDLTISRADGSNFTADLTLPTGTQFFTKGTERLVFETIADLTIPAGDLNGIVPSQNHETKTEPTLISDGSPYLSIRANFSPYIQDSIVIRVNNVTWVPVDNFLDSNAASQNFTVDVESDGTATFTFGDGVNGQIPPAGATIDISYRVGGGVRGRVPPDTVTEVTFTPLDVDGNPVDIAVTNLAASVGGNDREAIAVSQVRIPASLSSREVTVNRQDFAFIIESVPGIARGLALTVNDNPDIPENTVLCLALPEVEDTLSEALELQVMAAINNTPGPLTQTIWIAGPQFNDFEIDIRDLEQLPQFDDSSGVFAEAIITITNNTYAAGDGVIVNGVQFVQGVDWTPGGSIALSAEALAQAINDAGAGGEVLLHDIEAFADDDTVVVRARTLGEHGNEYTLTEVDAGTSNFTLSSATFTGGEDTTVQAAIRTQLDNYFGRTNRDEAGEYTSAFGKHVFRNDIIWQVRGVLIGAVKPAFAFDLITPADDVEMQVNQFPRYTLRFSTSREEDA